MSGGGEKTVTKNVNEPFAEQKGYLTDLYSRAQKVSGTPTTYWPYPTYANESPFSIAGRNAMGNAAAQPSPYLGPAAGQAGATLNGDFLSAGNPYLSSMFNSAAGDVTRNYQQAVMPGIASRYGQAGRVGSPEQMKAEGIAQQGLGTSLQQLAAGIYGPAYESERNRQVQTLGLAPSLEDSRFVAPGKAVTAGALGEAREQKVLDDWIAHFEYKRDEPYNRLAQYSSLLGSPVTGTGSQTTRSGSSDQTAQYAQAAAALASVFAQAF